MQIRKNYNNYDQYLKIRSLAIITQVEKYRVAIGKKS